MKRSFISMLALVLTLCTVFSLCGVLSSCGQLFGGDSDSQTPEGITDTTCTHAVTMLKNIREATCVRAGYTGDTVCTACGAIIQSGESVPALPHTMDLGLVTKEPTCIERGTTTYTCHECGLKETSPIEFAAHKDAYHDAEDSHTHSHTCATCTINGYEEHEPRDAGSYHAGSCTEPAYTLHVCKQCNASYKVWADDSTILGHAWPKDEQGNDVWQITEPTCTATGVKTRACSRCGDDETMTLKVAAEAHDYVEFARTNATCKAVGKIYYACNNENCNAEITKDIPVNPSAHRMSATTTPDGWTTDECQNGCGYQVKTYTAPAGETQASVPPSQIADDRTFEVKTEEASVAFPAEVISQIKEGNTGAVEINAGVAQNKTEILQNATNLSEAEKARLANVDIFNFSVSGVSGNFDAAVTVTVPYTLGDDEDPNGIKVWYVASDGTIQSFEAVFVPEASGAKKGTVTFEAEHFSYYAVAYEETQEAKCRRGVHRWMATDADDVVEATCTQYGYTVKECDTCHAVIYDDLTAKVGHNYGDFTDPTVTCTQGGYVTKVCRNEGCGHTLNFEYRKALGHTLDGAPTCTKNSVCTRCENVVTPAYGHQWSEWITIIEPTATKSGLRRKNCPKCGEIEEAKLAATGSIETVSFDSYEDLMEEMMETVLAFHNGVVTFKCDMNGGKETVTMDITVNEEGDSYVMLIDGAYDGVWYSYSNGIEQEHPYTENIQFLYRNGTLVWLNQRVESDSNREYLDATTDLESAFRLPYEVMLNYAKQTFDLYMPAVEGTFDEFAQILTIFDALCGDAVNDALKEAGSVYTVSSLAELYGKMQSVYTYMALTLGFSTTTEIGDVAVPTTHDFMEVLGAFSTVTTNADGSKTYVVDGAVLKRDTEAVLNWLKGQKDTALSAVVWRLLGEEVKTYYPEVTDWASFMNKMKASYTGTMLVKDAFNTAVSMLESKGICTMQQIYDIVDAIMHDLVENKEFDTEKLISENWNGTLDELAKEMDFADLNALYAELDRYMTETKLGELVVDYYYDGYDQVTGSSIYVDVTLAERVEEVLAALSNTAFTGNISVTLDAEGRLLGVDLDYDVDYTEEDGTVTQLNTVSLDLKRDDTVKVEIPEKLQPVSDVKLDAVYDSNGDMIITVPEGFDYDFEIGGYGNVPLSGLLEVDQELTREMGYTVYVLKREYWTNAVGVGNDYVSYNGKYYTYRHKTEAIVPSITDIVVETTISGLQADPSILIPDVTKRASGYAYINNNRVNVYQTLLNPMFQLDGVWYMAKSYGEYGSSSAYDPETGEYYRSIQYSIYTYKAFDAALFESIRISSTNGSTNAVMTGGEAIRLAKMYFTLDVDAWGTETVSAWVRIKDDGEVVLAKINTTNARYDEYYQLGEEIPTSSLPEHDTARENNWYGNKIKDANGNNITNDVKRVSLYQKMPTYYVKVAGDIYAGFDLTDRWDSMTETYTYEYVLPYFIRESFNEKTALKTMTLPDGNKLFVLGEVKEYGTSDKGEYDRVVYGYAKAGKLYIQAAVRYDGNKLIEVFYRTSEYYYSNDNYASSTRYMEYCDYLDLNLYLSKTGDNTYRVSKTLFDKLETLCVEKGNCYWIRVTGAKTVGEVPYEFTSAVGYYEKLQTLTKADFHYSGYGISWYEYFENSNTPAFSVVPSNNGNDKSITVRLNNGEEINVSYSLGSNYYVVDGVIPRDEEKSAATGYDIYGAVTDHENEHWVYQNGQYYEYWTRSNYDGFVYTTLNEIKNAVANQWYLTSLTYRYDYTDQSGKAYPVYLAGFGFGYDWNYGISLSSNIFVMVKNDKLYVLSGAVEEGASLLRFENMVPPAAYFADAATRIQETSNNYSRTDVAVNGKLYDLYGSSSLCFVDLNAQGETVRTVYMNTYYVKNADGTRSYVKGLGEWLTHDYLDIHSSGHSLTNIVGDPVFSTKTYGNGTFTFVDVTIARSNYYVKFAGEYYRYGDGHWNTYSQYSFESAIAASRDWYYGVYDEETGTYSYYNKLETRWKWENGQNFQYAVLSEPITTLPEFADTNRGQVTQSMKTEDGKTVVEFSGYVMCESDDELVAVPRSDGTVFYHHESSCRGFLKIGEGKYLRARMIVNPQNGTTRIICTELSRATLDYDEINYLKPLDKYVVVHKGSSQLKISKDILEAIPEECRDGFQLRIYRVGNSSYSVYLTYDELVGWFELTEEKNCNTGDFDGWADEDKNNNGNGNGKESFDVVDRNN